jgi:hypothetical protein
MYSFVMKDNTGQHVVEMGHCDGSEFKKKKKVSPVAMERMTCDIFLPIP